MRDKAIKAIIVTDIPESCSKCKFMYEFYGVKKCQLLNVLKNGGKAIICVDKLNVARKECCPLVSLEEHDKEIRNKAIEEFAEAIKAILPIAVHRDCSEVDYEVNYALYGLRSRIDRIVEQMKEVGE